jgi:hypothetical protein
VPEELQHVGHRTELGLEDPQCPEVAEARKLADLVHHRELENAKPAALFLEHSAPLKQKRAKPPWPLSFQS